MVSDRSSRALLIAVLAASAAIMLLAGAAAVTATIQGSDACDSSSGGAPSTAARQTIPPRLLLLFAAAERAYEVPWNVLAAVNKVETDFGRNLGPSSKGAIGWMQFLPATWARYGVDADRDGRANPDDPADAIFSAAAYLRASGAPDNLRGALFAYNHSPAYVEQVLAWADRFAELPARAASGLCAASAGEANKMIRIAPGANLPGRPLAPETLAFLARVAAIYGRPLVVTTGTNHSRYTVDGRVSDHADGHAADLGMTANDGSDDSPIGDRIMTAAGEPADRAAADAARGGLYTLEHRRLRVQCIWKTYQGRKPP